MLSIAVGEHAGSAGQHGSNEREVPAEVALREVPGHWEADLVMGAGNRTAILVITERVSRYVIIVPLGLPKDAERVSRALTRAPAHLRKTFSAKPSALRSFLVMRTAAYRIIEQQVGFHSD